MFAWTTFKADTLAALLVAQLCVARLGEMPGLVRAGAVLVAAFVANQVVLVAATPLLGGIASFAPDVVGQVFALNVFGFAGLFALTQIGRLAGVAPRWPLGRTA